MRWQDTLKQVQEYNKPYATAVLVNSAEIGDDNDYSIFLSKCVRALYAAGQKELALELQNTDPMAVNKWTMQDIESDYQRHIAFVKEQKESEEHYYRAYHD